MSTYPFGLQSNRSGRLIPWFGSLTALVLLVYIVIINGGTLRAVPILGSKVNVPENVQSVGYLLGIHQTWGMFCCPPFMNGWHVVPGRLQSGEYVDLMRNGQAVDWS